MEDFLQKDGHGLLLATAENIKPTEAQLKTITTMANIMHEKLCKEIQDLGKAMNLEIDVKSIIKLK